MSVKQVIVVRTKFPCKNGTFGMRAGKQAAQVAHASMKVFFDMSVLETCRYYEGTPEEQKTVCMVTSPLTPEMESWISGTFTKVVVGVETEEQLLEAHRLAKEAGLPTSLIQDIGATEFKGVPTYTTCAIGPADSEAINKITGPNGQVKVKLL